MRMKRALVITVLILLSCGIRHNLFASGLSSPQAKEIFDQANALYKENKYAEASAKFEKILQLGLESGNLYYNLANSYFKQGQIGKAVLNYERAGYFIPGDSDLKSNYDYSRSVLNLGREEFAGNKISVWLAGFFAGIGIDTLTIFLPVVYAVLFLVLILGLFFERLKRLSRPLAFILTVLFILGLVSLDRKIICLERGAIVISNEAEARFEPLESATAYFTLKEGSRVLVLEGSGNWCKIKRSDGKVGWVEKPALGFLDNK
jgi:tetratricopeptide (TPR) repeat protein